jgi:hypothetical protein
MPAPAVYSYDTECSRDLQHQHHLMIITNVNSQDPHKYRMRICTVIGPCSDRILPDLILFLLGSKPQAVSSLYVVT